MNIYKKNIVNTSLIIGCIIGLFIAFLRISGNKWLEKVAIIYIGLIRGTPLIVQIAILYFGIASIITFSQFWAGALALAIDNGAYIAEIFRGPSNPLIKDKWKQPDHWG